MDRVGGSRLLPDVMRVGDPINAIPVHGFGGIWGTLALAVVAPAAALPTQSHLAQIGVPITGVASVLCRALATGALWFFRSSYARRTARTARS